MGSFGQVIFCLNTMASGIKDVRIIAVWRENTVSLHNCVSLVFLTPHKNCHL